MSTQIAFAGKLNESFCTRLQTVSLTGPSSEGNILFYKNLGALGNG